MVAIKTIAMEKYVAEFMEGKFDYVKVIVDNTPRKVLKYVWDANYKLEAPTVQKKSKREIKVIIDGITYSGSHVIKLMNYSSFEDIQKTKYEMDPLSYEERNKLLAMLGTIAWCRIFMKETPTYKRYVDAVIESVRHLHKIVLAMHGDNSEYVEKLCNSIHLDTYLSASATGSGSWTAKNPTTNNLSIDQNKYLLFLIKELIKYKYPDFMRIENYGPECADLVGILYPQSNDKIGSSDITYSIQ